MTWWEYVVRVSGTTSPKEMADRTGIDAPSFSKWKSGAVPKAETVAKFARAYDASVLEGFLAAGFLTPEEASETPVTHQSLIHFTDNQLLDEIRRRFDEFSAVIHQSPGSGKTTNAAIASIRRARIVEAAQPVRQAAGTSTPRRPEFEPESQDAGDMEPR